MNEPEKGDATESAEHDDGQRRRRRTKRHVTNGQYPISDVADHVGVSASVLRVWEMRYGWPKPKRHKNGYRYYTEKQLEALTVVAELIQAGRSITEILADPQLGILEGKQPTLPPAKRSALRFDLDFSTIAMPSSPEGVRLRGELEDALRHADASRLARIESELLRLRPADRQLLQLVIQHAAATPAAHGG